MEYLALKTYPPPAPPFARTTVSKTCGNDTYCCSDKGLFSGYRSGRLHKCLSSKWDMLVQTQIRR